MIEHVEKITRKIEALEKIHDLMADALEDIALEIAKWRKELEASVQPELPLADGERPTPTPSVSYLADDLCAVCGNKYKLHTETDNHAYWRNGLRICQKFIPANKAGAPVEACGAGPAR